MGYEELAAIGAGACVGHGKDTWAVMDKVFCKLVLELVAWSAPAGSCGAPALDHEFVNHPVEGEAVVVSPVGKVDEICNGIGCLLVVEFQNDGPFRCFHDGLEGNG